MSPDSFEQSLQHLQSLATTPPTDPEQRRRMYVAAQKLARKVELPHDTIYRVLYSPILLIVAEIASNLEIFSILAEKGGVPCSAAELAAVKAADVTLTGESTLGIASDQSIATRTEICLPLTDTGGPGRIARWLAGHGMIDEVDEDQFASNAITVTLSTPGFRAGIKHYVYTTVPPLQVLPDFLEETKYTNPSNPLGSPFQKALHTDLSKFDWQRGQPDLSAAFGLWMAAQHDRQLTWLNVLNVRELVQGSTAETPVFVDVAGGIGHQCVLLKDKVPDLVGKIILQDSPTVIKNALPTPGVGKMEYDFWKEQPVRGSRIYYFRYIMHDYPDERCCLILKNTVAAMAHDSVILVDDVVLPEKGAHPHSLDKDIVMMVNFAAMERTKTQWRSLFQSCGLRLLKAATYNDVSGETIQVVVRSDRD